MFALFFALFFALLFAAMVSCGGAEIRHGRSFEEISKSGRRSGRPFCVVLVDRMQYLSGEFASMLRSGGGASMRRAAFDIVDVDDSANAWWVKWLCPESLPLTCVFSSEGTLTDLIPGQSAETLLRIAGVLESGGAGTGRWPNRFGLGKAEAVGRLRRVLLYREMLSRGLFPSHEVAATVDSLRYPWGAALKMEGFAMVGDTLSARTAAEELAAMKNPYYLDLYRSEFIMAATLLDPAFDLGNEATIRIDPATMELGDRSMDKTIPVEITLHNDGGKPLNIFSVTTDCSCLRRLGGDDSFGVAPGDSVRLSFALSPRVEGATRQGVVIASDAIDRPFTSVDIFANFKQ